MVKHVVKPLLLRILQERIVSKKSVFVRVFGVFCFGIPWGRCLAPKRRALPAAPHPDRVLDCLEQAQLSACLFDFALPAFEESSAHTPSPIYYWRPIHYNKKPRLCQVLFIQKINFAKRTKDGAEDTPKIYSCQQKQAKPESATSRSGDTAPKTF